MQQRFVYNWLLLLGWCLSGLGVPGVVAPASLAQAESRCVVATVQPLATDAAIAAFEGGGNAVDAAVAAALTLGVVDNHNSGLGGGCFVLLRLADGRLLAIDGREMAPAAATRDMYLRDGQIVPELSTTGPLAVGVPGALAAYAWVLEEYGRRKLDELLLPAAQIAEDGFAIDGRYAENLAKVADSIKRFEATRTVLLKSDGSPYQQGEILKQSDLAHSYRQIAGRGIDWFYRGPYAQAVAEWMAHHGGLITAEDFAHYTIRQRKPIVTTYRGYTIVGFPPPSSGGVHVAQILNMLENYDLRSLHAENPIAASHLVLEAMKRAFADRAYWLGDADFVDVPQGLIDKSYAAQLAGTIDMARASKVDSHGKPPGDTHDLFGNRHTTHIAAADSEGNWVAITATVNTSFGSNVIVPGTGIVLNNEMDDFSSQPGIPNAFGLVGAANNAIAPGKRPLSSMSPTIVLQNGQPVLTLGAAGGPKIITQVVHALLRTLDFGQSLTEAVADPRYHHQWLPDQVLVEQALPAEWKLALQRKGHKIEQVDQSGVTQAIGLKEGKLVGVHDPRVQGKVGVGVRP
jgi:gamma-glutamyltranspeptidase/glutathione hydrolase